jgi:hypothetical protein
MLSLYIYLYKRTGQQPPADLDLHNVSVIAPTVTRSPVWGGLHHCLMASIALSKISLMRPMALLKIPLTGPMPLLKVSPVGQRALLKNSIIKPIIS